MPDPIVIDLSHHNTIPSSLKPAKDAGIIGVIHKATEGQTIKDSKVDSRQALARDAGLLFGLYHFIRPGNITGQVNNFLAVYTRYDPKSLLVALDYEDMGVSLSDCENWLRQVEAATGKKPVMYSGHVLKEKLGDVAHPVINGSMYPLWLAQYGSKAELPPGWKNYWLWQYTDKGTVAGVNPPTDLNAGEVDRVREFWAGVAEPVPPQTSLDFSDAMRRVLDGGKMRRKNWNGKGMWIAHHHPVGDITLPFIIMSTVTGDIVPWLASHTDMCANDWEEAT